MLAHIANLGRDKPLASKNFAALEVLIAFQKRGLSALIAQLVFANFTAIDQRDLALAVCALERRLYDRKCSL